MSTRIKDKKAYRARLNRDFCRSNTIAFQSKVYFLGVGLPPERKIDIVEKMENLFMLFLNDDLEEIEDTLIFLNAENTVYLQVIQNDLRYAYHKASKQIPSCYLNPKYLPSVARIIQGRFFDAFNIENAYTQILSIFKNPKRERRLCDILRMLDAVSRLTQSLEDSLLDHLPLFQPEDSDVRECYIDIMKNGERPNQFIKDKDDELYDQMPYKGVPVFPLVDFYRNFQNTYGKYLNEKYGTTNHTQYIRPIHYWENRNFYNETIQLLKDFAVTTKRNSDKHLKKYLSYVKKDDVHSLAQIYLSKLDEYLSLRIQDARVVLDAVNGISHLVTSRIDTAAFLYVYAEIASNTKYGICDICGAAFLKSNHPNEHFCKNHTKAEKDKYTRTIRALEAKTAT